MERVKITLPDSFPFATDIPIRITDINYGNHLGNDAFLSLLHEARMQFLNSFGYTELDFAGIGLIMADAAIEYRQEVVYGETVTVEVVATGFDRIGFDIFYKLVVLRNGEALLVGKAKTGMIGFDYKAGKKASIPQAAIEQMSS